jgi:hypothetical protein
MKFEAVSKVSKSQEQALKYTRKFESQLICFIEQVIFEVEEVLGSIAHRAEYIYDVADQFDLCTSLQCLDLAGLDRPERRSMVTLRLTLDVLSVLIPHSLNRLDERRAQLDAWKDQRRNHDSTNETTATPTPKYKTVLPASPEVLDTLHRMKNFLNTSVLSPLKIRTTQSDQLDVEFFKSVIHTLERNIDVLLEDLRAANAALQEKDQRISELETFNASRETSEQQPTTAASRLPYNDVSTFHPSNNEGEHREESKKCQPANQDECKSVVGPLLRQAVDGRSHAAKAVAFREWSCQTSAQLAIVKHGETATALAQQLEETRDKLLVLKRHLKKTRRNGGGSSNSAGICGTLDCIPEDENEA